jgi:hypothetical protein
LIGQHCSLCINKLVGETPQSNVGDMLTVQSKDSRGKVGRLQANAQQAQASSSTRPVQANIAEFAALHMEIRQQGGQTVITGKCVCGCVYQV